MKLLCTLFITTIILSLVPFEQGFANDAKLMREVVEEFVQTSGREILGVGSWIKGNYGSGSDHDMRLVLPEGTSPKQAAALWKNSRATLNRLISEKFKDQADKIRRVTNLYPPSQLMSGVEDTADALVKYQSLNQVPNLGYAGKITEKTPAKYAEGLYGSGSRAWIREYETTAGRLFYKQGNSVFTGLTDLTHLSEGAAQFDVSGMAHTSLQWAEHCADELKAGRTDKVIKYLERMQRDLTKARDVGRLGGNTGNQAEVRFLISELTHEPHKLNALSERLQKVLWWNRFEAGILKQFGRVPLKTQHILGAIHADMASNSMSQSMSRFFQKASEKGLTPDRMIAGFALAVRVLSTQNAAGEEGYSAVLTRLAPGLLTSLGPQLLADMTQVIIDEAKSAGYDFAAASQEPWDLMSGIYTIEGRDDLDSGREYSLEDLVRKVDTEEKLSNLVLAKATLAAARSAGVATDAVDKKVAESTWARTFPVIRDAWQFRLDQLYLEFEGLVQDFQKQPLRLRYSPYPAESVDGQVTVNVEVGSLDRVWEKRLQAIEKVLAQVTRKGGYLNTYYRWNGGRPVGEFRDWRRLYTFTGEGPFTVLVTVSLSAGSDEFSAAEPLKARFVSLTGEAIGAVDVMVATTETSPSELLFKSTGRGNYRRLLAKLDGEELSLIALGKDGLVSYSFATIPTSAGQHRLEISLYDSPCGPVEPEAKSARRRHSTNEDLEQVCELVTRERRVTGQCRGEEHHFNFENAGSTFDIPETSIAAAIASAETDERWICYISGRTIEHWNLSTFYKGKLDPGDPRLIGIEDGFHFEVVLPASNQGDSGDQSAVDSGEQNLGSFAPNYGEQRGNGIQTHPDQTEPGLKNSANRQNSNRGSLVEDVNKLLKGW